MSGKLCEEEVRHNGIAVICWLPEEHEGDHYDRILGIYWYKREESGVREPRRDSPSDELAARRRFYREAREQEPVSALAWGA